MRLIMPKKWQMLNEHCASGSKSTDMQRKDSDRKSKGTSCYVIEAACFIGDQYDEICDELWYIHAGRVRIGDRLKDSRGYTEENIMR
ncbi:MAG: hypothetical protein ACLTKE_11040 [Coprococcus sp.]